MVESALNRKSVFPEESLYPVWQDFCTSKRRSADQRISGIFAGVLNRFDGPDFQGAEVEIDGIRYRGDVEIHLHQKDWFHHGHHLDSRYDRVVLHLVWNYENRFQQQAVNSKKLTVPTFSLQSLMIDATGSTQVNIRSCYAPADNRDLTEQRLQDLALQRLQEKAKQTFDLAAGEGKDQALYQLLVGHLGSPHNRDTFQHLAVRLPWQELQALKKTLHPTIEVWTGLLLHISGLPSHGERPEMESVKRICSLYRGAQMPAEIWKTGGQRPRSHPLIRLQGLAHFIHQWKSPSLYQAFLDLFIDRPPYPELLNTLYRMLRPEPSRSWYQQLSQPAVHPAPGVFWGKSVQTEMIGNILIPFFYQQARTAGSTGFADYLEEFFLFVPASSDYGRLRLYREWKDWFNLPVKRFYLNQALIRLQDGFCQRDLCTQCPLGRIQEKG
jgi:hypothetical protein